MTNRKGLLPLLLLAISIPALAGNKKHDPRGMLEKMEAVPCGAKERGITGLGSVFGSVGVQHVDSDEKLCPQYLLRTDDMEYHIRPRDHKHPALLPIGKEGEFKISKGVMKMRIPDGDHKMREYQVVAMKPIDHTGDVESQTKYDQPRKDYTDKPIADRNYADKTTAKPNNPPQ